MSEPLHDLATPTLLLDSRALDANLRRMQSHCDAAGVELWPHVKTHKMADVLRRQLALGAKGATCAKIGEAEAMLEVGVRRLFIAHSLVDPRSAPRLRALHDALDELVLAVTSPHQLEALEEVLDRAGIRSPAVMAIDTGLGREGARNPEDAAALAAAIRRSQRLELIGIYTHEGHAYGIARPDELPGLVARVHAALVAARDAVGGNLPLWPGCSVTATAMADRPGVRVIRPGAYVFGDLYLTEITGAMSPADTALHVLATVVDLPSNGLALIDAGSKVFSGDRTATGLFARCVEFPALTVNRVSEEHGFVVGPGVDQFEIGQRLRFIPAHVCPVVNLADEVWVLDGETVNRWPVTARGRSN